MRLLDMTLTDIPYGEANRASAKQGGLRQLNKGQADLVTFDLRSFVAEVIRVTAPRQSARTNIGNPPNRNAAGDE